MEKHQITVDGEPDIRFTGELVASTSTSGDNGMRNFSGSAGRWTELELYRTQGGKFVCSQVGRTQWQGERDRHTGKVCQTEAEVIEFFGHGRLAKDLYDEADIDYAIDVD